MSYDIRFAVKVAGMDDDFYAVIGEPEYDSPTWNNREIFRKCMDWDYKTQTWYKLSEIIPKIERGIHELQFNRREYLPLEPENGWGGVDSSLKCLKSIIQWATEELDSSWNRGIPLDCIYMRW